MSNPHPYHQGGFVALITVVILSFVLTVFAISASESGVRARLHITAIEDSWAAQHLAHACAAVATLYLAQNTLETAVPYVSGPVPVSASSTCEIQTYSYDGDLTKIVVRGLSGMTTQTKELWVEYSDEGIPSIRRWNSL